MLVIDASAIVDLLLDRPSRERIASHVADHAYDLHAPHVFDVEVLNALRSQIERGLVAVWRADVAVTDLLALSVERYSHRALGPRVWALRENFSAYDASYLALTEVLAGSGAALLTTDARFARAVRRHSGVEVLLAA
jgi:predicted nucleic acid-binding protein